jgi:hypothetical protein
MTDTFRFGNVNGPVVAGTGNVVASGDQYIAGGDLSVGNTAGGDAGVAEAIAALRQELARLRLTADERQSAEEHLDAVARTSDKREAADHLGAFVSVLKQANAVASAGSGLVEAVAKIAKWVGPLAAGVLALL